MTFHQVDALRPVSSATPDQPYAENCHQRQKSYNN